MNIKKLGYLLKPLQRQSQVYLFIQFGNPTTKKKKKKKKKKRRRMICKQDDEAGEGREQKRVRE